MDGRRSVRRALALVALGPPLLWACAYFNTLYNAERLFDEAERARARGDVEAADRAYRESAEKAAKGLRRDPDGAWADDALYLLARAHFRRGDERAARAALEQLLLTTEDDRFVTGAHAYLGAIRVRSGHEAAALAELDGVLRQPRFEPDLASFARIWRARARFALGHPAGAWEDLAAAAKAGGALGREAWLESATQAVAAADAPRARAAFGELFDEPDAYRWADTLRALAERALMRWDASTARALLEPAVAAPWPPAIRDEMTLYRAELAAAGGDTAAALAEAAAVADRGSAGTSDRARVLSARWSLTSATADELDDVRAGLLPAVADREARALLGSLETLEALTQRADEEGHELALFAAAELARDALGAQALAADLFTAYADAAPQAPWAPKALLAAAALELPARRVAAIRARLASYEGSVYLAALAGREGAGEPFRQAEAQLAARLATLRDDAVQEMQQRDAAIAYAASAPDSLPASGVDGSAALPTDSSVSPAECTVPADSVMPVGGPPGAEWPRCLEADSLVVPCAAPADSAIPGRLPPAAVPTRCPPADSIAPDTVGSAA